MFHLNISVACHLSIFLISFLELFGLLLAQLDLSFALFKFVLHYSCADPFSSTQWFHKLKSENCRLLFE